MAIDTLFIAAFGGPTPGCCKRFDPCPGEAYCFVSGVFGHNVARKARIDEVAAHYKELGGYSKFNEITEKQAEAIKAELARRGRHISIFTGYYHWNPYIIDKVKEMARSGQTRQFIALVMAPHQSSISWDAYLRRVQEGLDAIKGRKPEFKGVVDPFFDKPGFITALAENTRAAAHKLVGATHGSPAGVGATSMSPSGERATFMSPLPDDLGVLFSAHAVPMSLVKTSPYVQQVETTAKLVAEKLGVKTWKIGYQSQPSDSQIEWTSPSLESAVSELAASGAKKIVACAIGFLCDNVEVLYDMGIEGRHAAEKAGAQFAPAEAVNTHPAFIKMLADAVEKKIKSS